MGFVRGNGVKGLQLSRTKRKTYLVKRKACIMTPRKSPCPKRLKWASPFKLKATTPQNTRKRKETTPLKSSRKHISFQQEETILHGQSLTELCNTYKVPDEILNDLQCKDISEIQDTICNNTSYDQTSDDRCDAVLNVDDSVDDGNNVVDNDNNQSDVEQCGLVQTESTEELIRLLPCVIKEFERTGKLDVLKKFFRHVNENKFPLKNIAFLLWCDVVNWFDKPDTRQMRYSPECLQFLWVGKKLFGGRFIRFMSGPKSETALLKGHRYFDPQISKINFSCPSISVINSINPLGTELPLTYKPGILEPMIKLKATLDDRDNSYGYQVIREFYVTGLLLLPT